MELASATEQEEMERKRIETRKFFDEMEKNIRRKADPNNKEGDIMDNIHDNFDFEEIPERQELTRRGSIGGIRLVRTISSIDGRESPSLFLLSSLL